MIQVCHSLVITNSSRKLHVPPSLPTFHILLVLLVPREPILPKGKQSQNQQQEEKDRIILMMTEKKSLIMRRQFPILGRNLAGDFLPKVAEGNGISDDKFM